MSEKEISDLQHKSHAYKLRNILHDWKTPTMIMKELSLNAPTVMRLLNRWVDNGSIEVHQSRNKHGIFVPHYRNVLTSKEIPNTLNWTDAQLRAAILASLPTTPMLIIQSVMIDSDFLLATLNSLHRMGIIKKTVTHYPNKGCLRSRRMQELYYLAED